MPTYSKKYRSKHGMFYRKSGKKGRKVKYMTDTEQTVKIKKLEKQVRKNTDIIETKYKDTLASTTAFISNINGTFYSLTDIKPFDSTVPNANINRINQRVGHSVKSQSLNIRGEIYLPIPADMLTEDRTYIPIRVRMIFVQTLEELSTALTAKDFLDEPANPMSFVDAFYKRNRNIKLRILKDITYTLEPDYWDWSEPSVTGNDRSSGYTTTRPGSIKFNHKLTKYNKNLKWNASLNALTPLFGPIQMFLVSDTPHTAEVLWHSRHVFRDQ